jgi:hypothetical protein
MAGTLTVQNLQGPASGANANKIIVPSTHKLFAAGHVVQVVQGELGTTASGSTGVGANTYYDSGLSATITPNSVNSKILVNYTVHLGSTTYQIKSRIVRRIAFIDTPVGVGTAEGGRGVATSSSIFFTSHSIDNQYQLAPLNNTYLDDPLSGQASTFPVTYKIQVAAYNNVNWYLNRSEIYQNGGADGYDAVPLSTITLMEIAQ